MPDRIRAAVVGAGVIGELHAKVLDENPRFEIVAIVDRDVDRARALATQTSLNQPQEPPALPLDQAIDKADVVAVCTPSGTHGVLGEQVLSAGRHLVVEKPIEVSLPAARRLHERANSAPGGPWCVVISQHRFDPAAVALHEAITSGSLGRPTSGIAVVPWWRGDAYYASAEWRGTLALDGGGALMNQGIHTLDLLLWMHGPVASVAARSACLAHQGLEVEDTLGATIAFRSGAIGSLLVTTAAYPELPTRLQIHGSRGSAVIEGDGLLYFHSSDIDRSGARHDSGGGENTATGWYARFDDGLGLQMGASHARQYDDLADALLTGGRPKVTSQEAIETLAVIDAIYRSAETGAWADPGS